jgi:sigma-B regulation protein RsbU (phosphoserine phosphatase)
VSEVPPHEFEASHPSLSRRLLLGLHLTVLAVMGVFLLWDYHVAWDTMLEQKRVALEEEATMLAEALLQFHEHQGKEAAQQYIDKACGAMQDAASPGHHIAVQLGKELIQARSHRRDSRRMWVAMEYGSQQEDGVAPMGDDLIVVGKAMRPELSVYVSEKLSRVEDAVHNELLRRIMSIVLVGLVIVLVVNVGVDRFMARPLSEMMEIVRRFGRGERDARMPRSYPRELGALAEEFDRMADALSEAERERSTRMEKARRVQENLHPDLGDVPGFAVSTLFEPAEEVAGDFYDVISLPDGTTLFCMGDVTDHGVPAAMSAGMLKTSLEHALHSDKEPEALLRRMNDSFARTALPEDFATIVLARWDREAGRLTYASAGHETCYLVCEGEGGTELVHMPSTGLVLGVEEEASWREDTLAASPGDMLVMLTDGVVEARSESGEQFGRQRVQKLLEEYPEGGPDGLTRAFRRQLIQYRGMTRQADDITLLAARSLN